MRPPPVAEPPFEAEVDSGNTVRCSEWCRRHGLDPVGTAGSYAGYLLVEWPLPWPRDVSELDVMEGARDALGDRGIRVQLLVPPEGPDRSSLRIALYLRPPGLFTRYVGKETSVPFRARDSEERDALGRSIRTATEELLAGGGSSIPQPDVLVCTHGRRDRCCGSFGTELWRGAESRGDIEGRLARTSHTGGHRFAPTGIVLPDGTLWAYLDPDLLAGAVSHRGPLAQLLRRYRGCSGLSTPSVQAVERAIFARMGWRLLSLPREGQAEPGGRVTFRIGPPEPSVWTASVRPGRSIPIPPCGGPLTPGAKTETEHRVIGLSRTG